MAVVVKSFPVLFVLSLLCMAISLPGAHSARLLRDNFCGSSDNSSNNVEREEPEDDVRYLKCWQFAMSPTLLNKTVFLQCWLLALAPAPVPTASAPGLVPTASAPGLVPTALAPINDEKEKLEDGAMYLQCWSLAPTSTPTSSTPINDDKKDNPKLLFVCGYPCCGFNIHGPCKRCCPKSVLHPPSPTTYVEEAGNGGGDGHGGGD